MVRTTKEPFRCIVSVFANVILLLILPLPLYAGQVKSWVSVGPNGTASGNDVISGQANALAVDPTNADVVYLGSSEGGVWKTTNGGATWRPLTDYQLVRKLAFGGMRSTLSIGSLAVDPANPYIVYAGTGDPNVACCFNGSGLGVFRSVNGGDNWSPLGADPLQVSCENSAMAQTVVNRISIRRRGNEASIFAATNLGLYRYDTEGGDCWKRVPVGFPYGNVNDMATDAQGALYIGVGSLGIYKSDALVQTWKLLSGGLPSAGFRRIALATSRPGQTSSVYAGFATEGGYRLFRSLDDGTTWSELPSPPSDGQLDFNNVIAVGTKDSNTIFIGLQ